MLSSLMAFIVAQRRWDLEDVSKSVNKLRRVLLEPDAAM
jgi:hypothetical protein